MNTHTSSAARFLAIGFSVVLLIISATTSFAFFVEFFPEIIPGSVLAKDIGALVSGAIGVALFDVATVVWLLMFLHDAATPQQRAIALILAVFTFMGSAAASVAYLSLSAEGSMDVLDVATKTTVASFALVIVLLGIVSNFGASQMYNRYSYDNIMKVQEANRRDKLLAAEFEQAGFLDKLIEQQVKEKITAIAPTLAESQAQRIVDKFHRGELSKYENPKTKGKPALPSGKPKREATHNPYKAASNGATPAPLVSNGKQNGQG